ncbi:MAG: methyltransferase type 11 [Phycisphaeraceae bacterium]|nr:methyltransferase type 11 [Phycisphaeraceae bacterium]
MGPTDRRSGPNGLTAMRPDASRTIPTPNDDEATVKARFEDVSYALHAGHYEQYAEGGECDEVAQTWCRRDTVDAWRHQRMYETIGPILAGDPGARWLTVGDGRYGQDARYLLDHGADVVATDISDTLLREARDKGFITAFRCENAEALSFGDRSFDYVLCKESYHHFPRPMLALYEMLRVARKGVVLIEPNDDLVPRGPLEIVSRFAIHAARLALGRRPARHEFEVAGNFVYKVSRREIEKAAVGVDLAAICFEGFNDIYVRGVEHEQRAERGPIFRRTRMLIGVADLLCGLRLMDHTMLSATIFKRAPAAAIAEGLSRRRVKLIALPDNPYASPAGHANADAA